MATEKVRDKSVAIEITGIEEIAQFYRKAAPEVNKLLQEVNKQFAQEVVSEAKQRAYARVPGRQASAGRPSGRGSISRSVGSIRANATAKSSSIVAGGPKAPGFFGHEFGGGARPETRQFPLHRGRKGYFMYPTIREKFEGGEERWNQILDEVFGRDFPVT